MYLYFHSRNKKKKKGGKLCEIRSKRKTTAAIQRSKKSNFSMYIQLWNVLKESTINDFV
jgi:hypothetical protein